MRLEGNRLIFINSNDFMEFIPRICHIPSEAFSSVIKLENGEFGFDILDDESYVLIKLAV